MKKGALRTTLTLALVAVFLAALYFLVGKPMIKFVGDPQKLSEFVKSQGILAYLVFGLFVFVQTMSTCIPGLPFYLAAGYLLGGVKGALLCDAFATLGNTAAFLIGRKYGRSFLCYLFPENKLKQVEELVEEDNPTFIHILFMFLPLPKDTYAWLGYYSEESLLKWVFITFIARFPHIFLYTYGGEKLMSNQYGLLIAGGIFAVILYAFVIVFLKKKKKNLH
ncbi:TVP38/TMEM64 family protein [Butyrivibrio proteoclasticus]|uniref:TVP38/TMEM64 family protein n=1 Tax=Butyrivibrio proteoclasticus TaxID=43305 RepID=UPI0004788D20|nr:VTT domain-containing protein [Butyrivibrio proteoclasticus]